MQDVIQYHLKEQNEDCRLFGAQCMWEVAAGSMPMPAEAEFYSTIRYAAPVFKKLTHDKLASPWSNGTLLLTPSFLILFFRCRFFSSALQLPFWRVCRCSILRQKRFTRCLRMNHDGGCGNWRVLSVPFTAKSTTRVATASSCKLRLQICSWIGFRWSLLRFTLLFFAVSFLHNFLLTISTWVILSFIPTFACFFFLPN